MKALVPWLFTCALGLGLLAGGVVAWSPPAAAQFFWSPFFGGGQPAARPKARPKPRPPGDDLPPIVPKQSTAPPPPDDRPYDPKLLRLAEILGAVHYLRELCGAQEGQLWRNQMKELLRYEGSTAVRRAKLVNSFNDGYRGYRRTYRTCTSSATLAVTRFLTEGAQITDGLAKPTHAVATAPAGETEEGQQGEAAAKPPEGAEASKPQAGEAQAAAEAKPADANASAPQEGEAPAPEAKPAEGQASASQEGASSSPQASAGEAEAAEPEPKPRRKPRRARRAPPPTPGWFPLINR
jgi:uncharacterized protein (TIGR02301 family)